MVIGSNARYQSIQKKEGALKSGYKSKGLENAVVMMVGIVIQV